MTDIEDLDNIVNRVNIDLRRGGVGDPEAWKLVGGRWLYVPNYLFLPDDKIPFIFRNNFERIRMKKDPNPDNWEQSKETGQWRYYPNGNPTVQERRRIERQRFQESERRRLEEGEDEIRSAESYHSETSQPSDIPGMLTPKMPNLENLPINEYNRELIKKIRRSYKKLKREYPSRPTGDRLRGLHWPELENFRNLVFDLNYQRQAIINEQGNRRDFIYPRRRGYGPLTSLTPLSVQNLGFGSGVRTRVRMEDEPWYDNMIRLRRQGNPWNGYLTPEHSTQLRSLENARGLNRIPATIRYWLLHSEIAWRLYTGDYSWTQRTVDTITRIITESIRAGRDFRQEVRDYLLQQGFAGREIENLFQNLSGILLELMYLPGNILRIPQRSFNFLRDLFTSFIQARLSQPEPEPEPEPEPRIVSHFRPYQGTTKKRKKSRRRTRRRN